MSDEVPGAAIPDMGAIDDVASTATDSPLGDTIDAYKNGSGRASEFLRGVGSARRTTQPGKFSGQDGITAWGGPKEVVNPYA